jgi:lysophospholipase L1-like esterase
MRTRRHTSRSSLAGVIATVALSAAVGAQAPDESVRIVLVGDSTVAEGGGWGPGFRASFGPAIDVVNRALNGRSSKSFRDEGHWEPALAERPDYVLIQFGHNDGPGKGPERETDPTTTYREDLSRYVDEARAAGAIPILVTSIVRRTQTADGKVTPDSLVPYVDAARRLAADRHLPLMDLYALTLAQCERLGLERCQALDAKTADGGPDTTHLGPIGQREVGAIAAREFLRVVLPAQHDVDPKSITAHGLIPMDRARTTHAMPVPRDPALPSLVIIGDSTVGNVHGEAPDSLWGWGDAIAGSFDLTRLNVVNRAIPGLSSRTYLTQGHWGSVMALLKPGDVVLMQFGHNDTSAVNDPTRARGSIAGIGDDTEVIDNLMTGDHEVVHTYGWYLDRFVRDARGKGASVVVCSPVPRRIWEGTHIFRGGDYAPWAKAAAERARVPFIDLNARVAARYDAIGAQAAARFFPSDNTHTNRAGAEVVAATVIEGLRALRPDPVAAYLRVR